MKFSFYRRKLHSDQIKEDDVQDQEDKAIVKIYLTITDLLQGSAHLFRIAKPRNPTDQPRQLRQQLKPRMNFTTMSITPMVNNLSKKFLQQQQQPLPQQLNHPEDVSDALRQPQHPHRLSKMDSKSFSKKNQQLQLNNQEKPKVQAENRRRLQQRLQQQQKRLQLLKTNKPNNLREDVILRCSIVEHRSTTC